MIRTEVACRPPISRVSVGSVPDGADSVLDVGTSSALLVDVGGSASQATPDTSQPASTAHPIERLRMMPPLLSGSDRKRTTSIAASEQAPRMSRDFPVGAPATDV